MSVMYRTKQADVLDAVVFKYYDGQPGALEQVLDANKGIADYGAILPAGVEIDFPELPKPSVKESVRLW
ncbi:tail protein X [Halodesulfovibrio sp. MK-HDV]|jgi:phage tail protein X|uniref:tail protein X n=1 Tax=unclassified Halodesulfovibrio TaxID=2644657 RepID=UPI00136FBD97|nr:tail protein X [Halodesulfovibrio sp. MK-HDV]KAF1075913.1 hypothetical protein MKHDV_01711 [Halodesulfovibrio sp. MK-HDV]